MAFIGITLSGGKSVGDLPVERLRAVCQRIRVARAHAIEIAELQMQHARVRIEPRIGRAACDRVFRNRGGGLLQAAVVEQLDRLDREADRLRRVRKQRTHDRVDRAHAAFGFQYLRKQERGRCVIRMFGEQTPQQRFRAIALPRLPEHAREREPHVDRAWMLGLRGGEHRDRTVDVALQHERAAAFEPVALVAILQRIDQQ